tara:strand:- start:279 stop:926 length:648 start_codon:yes stop_codon:yes gene_type:complete
VFSDTNYGISMFRPFSLLCLTLFISTPILAITTNNFEVTPLIGYRFGGDFDVTKDETISKVKLVEGISYGLLTAWSYDRSRQGELLITHYNTEFSQHSDFVPSNEKLGVTYAHIGGNVNISKNTIPLYITGGMGMTHFSPKGAQLDSETRFSMNIGLTSKIPLSEQLSFQFGGRIYGTFFNSDSSIFCEQTNCLISMSSDIWIQTEVTAGLSLAF